MKTLRSIIRRCKQPIPRCHVTKAYEIDGHLKAGLSYLSLTGKRMKHNRDLISFRLGRNLRLLYTQSKTGLEPLKVVSRQNLEKVIHCR